MSGTGPVRPEKRDWRAGTDRRPAAVRFWEKVSGGDVDTCWTWIACLAPEGYGQFRHGGQAHKAHRWAYEDMVGEIPAGLHIDHLCRNRACVNPWHLEPVTPLVNVNRSPIGNSAKTECPSGHPYDDANTYHRGGRRYCRTCQRQHFSRFQERRKMTDPPLLLTPAETAAKTGIPESFLRSEAKAGRIPHKKVGKVSIKFSQDDIDETLRLLHQPPRAEPERLTSSRAKRRRAA